MEWVLWLFFFITNLVLMAANLYQLICLSDLEADYLNPYELASRINAVIVPEFLLHGAFCILFLLTGHWFMFLLTLLPAYYNAKKYMTRQHLIDVTEVFRVLNAEKTARIFKLGFYIVFFTLVIVRLAFSVINAVFDEDDNVRGFGLS
ncbi:Protein cornichon-like protein 1 [Forsythia ovata]|uniref:Protein cornichon-like protein 1 n=1 Tax=Forsythia ovata TaxID=205694 RepID=A0ABD1PMH5_9LAMI